MTQNENLLEIRDLSIRLRTKRGDVNVVDKLQISIPRGSSVGLVGESGSGKSMTALAIMRLLPKVATIVDGEILFEGEDIASLGEERLVNIRGQKISMIFQSSRTSLNPLMRVGDQIARVYKLRRGFSKKDAWDRSVEMLRAVGIMQAEQRARSYPHHLSGGMAQRVLIALMLACNPQLLIADEPTTGLDVTTEAQILDLIQEMRISAGISLLFITHDLGLIASNCDFVGVMHAGHIVEFGPVRELFKQPKHPYTQLFLSSIPRPDQSELSDSKLVGYAPDPYLLPEAGCRFISRCPQRFERCTLPVPWVEFGQDHKAFCHLYEQTP